MIKCFHCWNISFPAHCRPAYFCRGVSSADVGCAPSKADPFPEDLTVFDEFDLPTLDDLLGDCAENSMAEELEKAVSCSSKAPSCCGHDGGCCHSGKMHCASLHNHASPALVASPVKDTTAAADTVCGNTSYSAPSLMAEQILCDAKLEAHPNGHPSPTGNCRISLHEPSSSHGSTSAEASPGNSDSKSESHKRQRTEETPETPLRLDFDERACSPIPDHSQV